VQVRGRDGTRLLQFRECPVIATEGDRTREPSRMMSLSKQRQALSAVEEKFVLQKLVTAIPRKGFHLACTLSFIAIFLFSSVGWIAALDPHTRISQYGHTAWRLQDGFLGDIESITQTTDGYMWIAAGGNLFRFDGVNFRRWTPPNKQSLPSTVMNYVLGARDGSLWIGTTAGLVRLKDGRLTNYTTTPNSPGISAILEDHAGRIWVTRYRVNDGMGPLCWAKDSALECYGEKEGNPARFGLGMTEDSTGDIWFAGVMLYRWHQGSSVTYFNEQVKNQASDGVLDVIAAPSGEILASVDGIGPKAGIQHFSDGKWSSYIVPGFDGRASQSEALFVDRRQTLWIGTYSNGLYHIHDGLADHYGSADGLSSDYVDALYEDREGNLWVGTDGGIDLFRDNAVINFSKTQGLVGTQVRSVLTVNGDDVWVARAGGLNVIQAKPFSSIRRQMVPGRDVSCMFVDSKGQVWLGVDDRVFAYKNAQYVEVKQADGSALGRAESFAEDLEGNLWLLSRSSPHPDYIDLLLIRDQRVRQEFRVENGKTTYLAADRRAGVWTLSLDGKLTHYIDGREQEAAQLGNASRTFNLDVDSHNAVWAATNKGLYRWDNGQLTLMSLKNGLPCSRIYSLIQDDQGSHWLRTECGILRVTADEWERWLRFPESRVSFVVFDAPDGAHPGESDYQPSVTNSRDGRLWFASGPSVQLVDPNRLTNLLPPPVHIEEVVADHKTYESLDNVAVPHLRGELEIDYTALSYQIPQRVLFRYKLEGHDEDWQEVGTRRQAFYNDLRPGKYRFRVRACNNDGVWNEAGAFLDFSVLPAYYQTAWFRGLCGAAFLLLLWFIYQYRLRQLQHQFNIGLEAQVNERTRIARDLHDTLLQTFHGLMFQFQAVRNLMPRRPDEAMRSLDDAINETEKALTESRDAIKGLRSEPIAKGDLAELLRAASQELATSGAAHRDLSNQDPPVFDLIEEGERRTLSMTTKNEICRIAFEILRNAFKHAHAHRIEVEIRYDGHVLRLRIRDDGTGIDPTVLKEGGSAGHWGLRGVRERAERIGAQLEYWSNAGAGTEVQLSVPAAVAYEASRESLGTGLFRKVTNRGQHS
jgi:signal transduction histidine kinase/streptogramin lyase